MSDRSSMIIQTLPCIYLGTSETLPSPLSSNKVSSASWQVFTEYVLCDRYCVVHKTEMDPLQQNEAFTPSPNQSKQTIRWTPNMPHACPRASVSPSIPECPFPTSHLAWAIPDGFSNISLWCNVTSELMKRCLTSSVIKEMQTEQQWVVNSERPSHTPIWNMWMWLYLGKQWVQVLLS